MARVDASTKSLLNGVSTRHIYRQSPGFASIQDNMRATIQHGLRRREGTEWISVESDIDFDPATDVVQEIVHEGTGYWAIFRTGVNARVVVVREDGVIQDVTERYDGLEYLVNATPEDITTHTFRDFTFVANRNISPQLEDEVRENNEFSLLTVLAVPQPDTDISVSFNDGAIDRVVTFTVPDTENYSVSDLARDLAAAINDPVNNVQFYTAVAGGNTVSFISEYPEDFTYCAVNVESEAPNQLRGINGWLESVTQLPAAAPIGEIIEIRPREPDGISSSYFVAEAADVFEDDGGGPGPDPTDRTLDDAGYEWNWEWSDPDPDEFYHKEYTAGYWVDQYFDSVGGESSAGTIDNLDYPQVNPSTTIAYFVTIASEWSGANRLLISFTDELDPSEFPFNIQVWDTSGVEDVLVIDQEMEQTNETSTRFWRSVNNDIAYNMFRDQYKFRIVDSTGTPLIEGFIHNDVDGKPVPGVVWRETSAPGQRYKVDYTSMPHVLAFVGNSFNFGPAAREEGENDIVSLWPERSSGNERNNQFPLVNEPIRDVSVLANRLVLLTANETILSVTDNLFALFKQSVLQPVSSDPISVGSTTAQDVPFDYMVPHDEGLIVFSEVGQFTLRSDTALTPDTAVLSNTSRYSYTGKARPASSGIEVYFPFSYGAHSGVQRLMLEGGRDTVYTARTVTDEIPRYIDGDIRLMSVSVTQGLGVYVADGNRNHVYVNELLRTDDGQVFDSWHRFVISPNMEIHGITIRQDAIHLMVVDDGLVKMLKMGVNPVYSDVQWNNIYLDNKGRFDGVTTSVTLPDNYPVDTVVLVQGDGCPEPGNMLEYVRDGNLLTLEEDMVGGSVHFGHKFSSVYQPSRILIRDEGRIPQARARLRIVHWILTTEESSEFRTEIITPHYTFPPMEFYGAIGDDIDTVYNNQNIADRQLTIPFKQQAGQADLRITADNYQNFSMAGLEWVGGYNKRGRRF